MGIGIWKAITNTFREKKESAAKALADPIRDEKFDIEDKKKEIVEFTRQLASLNAEIKKIEGDVTEASKNKVKFDGWARQAAEKHQAGDTAKDWLNLLNQAAAEVAKFEKIATEKTALRDTQRATEKRLRSSLDKARNQIAAREQSLHSNAARLKSAQITKTLNEAAAGMCGDDGSADPLAAQVRQAEAEAAAVVDLAATPDSELSDAFSDVDVAANDLADKYLSGASTHQHGAT